jgi:hypothetical protein
MIRTIDPKPTRTINRVPNLRLELINGVLTARGPSDHVGMVLSDKVDADVLAKANRLLWRELKRVRDLYAGDPRLAAAAKDPAACDLYIAGLNTLLILLGPDQISTRLDAIRAFCQERVPAPDESIQDPSILELASNADQHVPLELLPLFGTIAACADSAKGAAAHLLKLLPGYRTIIRRRDLRHAQVHNRRTDEDARYAPVTVRFFRHNGLYGSHKEIERLRIIEKDGRLAVAIVFPPSGHRKRRRWPEVELAEIVATDLVLDGTQTHRANGAICHFACHLYDRKGEGAYLELRPERPLMARAESYFLDQIRAARPHVVASDNGPKMVFLGTCRSGVEDQVRTSAVEVFRYYQPQCLVGSLSDVPDLAAAEFSSAFYRELSQGSSVGAALRTARIRLLEEFDNPFGLLFTSYFGEDMHWDVPSDRLRRYLPDEGKAIAGPLVE